MSKEKQQLISLEIEELAADLCGLKDDYETSDVDDALYEKYDIDSEHFDSLVRELYKRLHIGVSPLTNTPMIGIVNSENNAWLVKKDITGFFIAAAIGWMTENEDLAPGKGFERTITVGDGKPEFIMTIKKVDEERTGTI